LETDIWSGGIGLQYPDAEIDLHPIVVSPSTGIREPGDRSGRLGIDGRMTYVLCPDRAYREVRRGNGDVIRPFGRHHIDNVVKGMRRNVAYFAHQAPSSVVEAVASGHRSYYQQGNQQRIPDFHDGSMFLSSTRIVY
jgi:hypothetical protein